MGSHEIRRMARIAFRGSIFASFMAINANRHLDSGPISIEYPVADPVVAIRAGEALLKVLRVHKDERFGRYACRGLMAWRANR
jgi:hypothetical protein